VGEESGKSALVVVVVALIGAPVFVIILLVVLLAGGGATPPPCGSAGGGVVAGGGCVVRGGDTRGLCGVDPEGRDGVVGVPAPVIAAQLEQESGFHDALSSTGAQGPAQFEPATWATWGKDTTGKGFADVHNPSDAIDAQARFDAALAGQVKAAQAAGQIRSSASVTEMALGGYNAGIGAVLAAGGIPANSQTQAYVPRIMSLARGKFSQAGTVTAPGGTAPPGAGAGGGTGTQASGCGNAGQIDVRQVDYPVPGGGTQPGDLYLPAGAGPGTTGRPVIVMIHGGGFYFGNRSELADAARGAATHGYVVFNADYDLSVPHWPRELDQTRAAVDFVRTQAATYGIDPTRIALLGDSAGGTLVAEAGLTGNHSGVQAVVSWSGAMNFETLPAQALAVGDSYQKAASVADPAIYLGCLQVLCPQLYRQASPALAITAGAPPTLLVNSATELVPTGR